MTDEKLRLQKHPGYRIYSPVPVNSGEILEYEDKQWVRAEDYVALQHANRTLAARLAEAEWLFTHMGHKDWFDRRRAWLGITTDSARSDQPTEPP